MSEWPTVSLGDVAVRVAEKNTTGIDTVATVSALQGLVRQESYFTKRVASRDLSTYTVVRPGDYVYNKSHSTDAPIGVVTSHRGDEPVVVSPLYIVFRVASDLLAPGYLDLAVESSTFAGSLAGLLREGARVHGLLNVRLTEFFSARIAVPSLEEQQRIVDIIAAVDAHTLVLQAHASASGVALSSLRTHLLGSLAATVDLTSVMTDIRSGGTPSRKDATFYRGDIPWLKSGEVASPWIAETDELISREALRQSSAWVVPASSVVVAMYGATAAQVGYLANPMATNQAVLALVPDSAKCDGRFAYHWIKHNSDRLREAATGAAQPNLSKAVILREVQYPDIDSVEQSKIAEVLDAAEELFRCLMAEAGALRRFRGLLVASLFAQSIAIAESYGALSESM